MRDSDPQPGKVFVGGLNLSITDQQLEEAFSKYGKIADVLFARHKNGMSRGFAFVTFEDPKVADHCIKSMDGQLLYGKKVTVEEAMPVDSDGRGRGRGMRRGGYRGMGRGHQDFRYDNRSDFRGKRSEGYSDSRHTSDYYSQDRSNGHDGYERGGYRTQSRRGGYTSSSYRDRRSDPRTRDRDDYASQGGIADRGVTETYGRSPSPRNYSVSRAAYSSDYRVPRDQEYSPPASGMRDYSDMQRAGRGTYDDSSRRPRGRQSRSISPNPRGYRDVSSSQLSRPMYRDHGDFGGSSARTPPSFHSDRGDYRDSHMGKRSRIPTDVLADVPPKRMAMARR